MAVATTTHYVLNLKAEVQVEVLVVIKLLVLMQELKQVEMPLV